MRLTRAWWWFVFIVGFLYFFLPLLGTFLFSLGNPLGAVVGGLVVGVIEQFSAGGRQDLVDKEAAELAVLEGYLPRRLSAEEIQAEVAALVAEIGAAGPADMGKTMAAAKARFSGRAEMSLVSAAVKAALAR